MSATLAPRTTPRTAPYVPPTLVEAPVARVADPATATH